MSLGSILRALFGGSDDKPSHNRGMDGDRPHHGHEGHHGDRPGRGPAATDTTVHGAVEAEEYSRKAEIKENSQVVEGPKKINKRRRDE
ncbi:MAG: hypothetical protein IKU06_10340 [Lachnospiraceae bacterium]|nr:hypothetical protein [Lachnospiraceae bacterium]